MDEQHQSLRHFFNVKLGKNQSNSKNKVNHLSLEEEKTKLMLHLGSSVFGKVVASDIRSGFKFITDWRHGPKVIGGD